MEYVLQKLYTLPAIVIAFTLHEWGHAYSAYRMGDPTARNLGRMTLNPLAHIDPIGFLMLVIVGFGWAKPVPVNPRNYRNYRTGELVVSLAGVTMNLLIAIVSAFIYCAVLKFCNISFLISGSGNVLRTIIFYFVYINLCLLVFNLIPIYPLDGFHVAEVLLAKHIGPKPFQFLRRYGSYILMIIIFLGVFLNFSIIGTAAGFLYTNLMKFVNMLFGIG